MNGNFARLELYCRWRAVGLTLIINLLLLAVATLCRGTISPIRIPTIVHYRPREEILRNAAQFIEANPQAVQASPICKSYFSCQSERATQAQSPSEGKAAEDTSASASGEYLDRLLKAISGHWESAIQCITFTQMERYGKVVEALHFKSNGDMSSPETRSSMASQAATMPC